MIKPTWHTLRCPSANPTVTTWPQQSPPLPVRLPLLWPSLLSTSPLPLMWSPTVARDGRLATEVHPSLSPLRSLSHSWPVSRACYMQSWTKNPANPEILPMIHNMDSIWFSLLHTHSPWSLVGHHSQSQIQLHSTRGKFAHWRPNPASASSDAQTPDSSGSRLPTRPTPKLRRAGSAHSNHLADNLAPR